MSTQNGSDADSFSKTARDGTPTEIVAEENHTKSGWISRAFFQLFCLLWLVPILFMLVMNFKVWIIGASAWCPGGSCWADIFDASLGNVWNTAHRLDVQSHDLVGALQFVAKILEVWFIIIATSLVYLYTMWLAERADGLPVRYLTWPSEFSDITSIFSRSLWTVAYSTRNKNKRFVWQLPFFVVITVLLCVLCAVMGPSVAVVIIPSLQWIPVAPAGDLVFNEVMSSSPPDAGALMDSLELQYGKGYKKGHFQQFCTKSQLEAGDYSCTTATLGFALDSLVEQYTDYWNGYLQQSSYGLVQELGVASIMFNTTNQQVSENSALWTPNRQLMREIGKSRYFVGLASLNYKDGALKEVSAYDKYKVFNRSLEMRIQRNGPMIGARPTFWQPGSAGNAWTTFIDSNRSIRCYPDFSILWYGEPGPLTTKCIRMGTGWNAANKQLNFTIANGGGDDLANTNVQVSFSNRAAYLARNELPSWLPASCLSNGKNGVASSNATCDWDRLFSLDVPSLANRTENLNTLDFFNANDLSAPFLSFDFVAYLGFSLYQLDPSPSVNPLALVQPLMVPETGPSLIIDPAWVALAFSVDTSSGKVPANRSSAIQFANGINEVGGLTLANFVIQYAILNMLTQLPYSTISANNAEVDSNHPLLELTGSVYVYAYRINSRTSVFSVVVVITGCVVVFAHFLLRLWYYRPQKSIKEVVISALEHHPQGEFEGVNSGEEAVKTRFKVEHSHQSLGELVFRRQH